jgi:hypothetical protein
MQELKPVAWMRSEIEKADCPFGYYGPVKCYPDDVPLYAIPDTHRIVPVEDLKNVAEELYFWINRADTRNMSESEYKTWLALWSQSKTVMQLRAIIYKEQS